MKQLAIIFGIVHLNWIELTLLDLVWPHACMHANEHTHTHTNYIYLVQGTKEVKQENENYVSKIFKWINNNTIIPQHQYIYNKKKTTTSDYSTKNWKSVSPTVYKSMKWIKNYIDIWHAKRLISCYLENWSAFRVYNTQRAQRPQQYFESLSISPNENHTKPTRTPSAQWKITKSTKMIDIIVHLVCFMLVLL